MLPVPEILRWPTKYEPTLKEFAPFLGSGEDDLLLKQKFADRLREILIRETGSVYNGWRVAEIIANLFPRVDRVLQKVEWESWIQEFAKLQISLRDQSIVTDDRINIRFEELLNMTDDEITTWIDDMHRRVLDMWDKHGTPPFSHPDPLKLIEALRDASIRSIKPFLDELEGNENVLIQHGHLASIASLFFPTMLKTKIQYAAKPNGAFDGESVYDLFATEEGRRRMQEGCRRHFLRDSFYHYSESIAANSTKALGASTGVRWVREFWRSSFRADHGFWLCRSTFGDARTIGSGYTQVDRSRFLWLSKDELLQLRKAKLIPESAVRNLPFLREHEQYHIRLYMRSARLFPKGFTAFKIGYRQVPANFPPTVAKFLIEKYTDNLKHRNAIHVYDSSAGWGGRIAGAMLVKQDRHIHYIGTDPNSDNYLKALRTTRYAQLATFINNTLETWDVYDEREFRPHKFTIYRMGSEVIGNDARFKPYAGRLDLAFTSPPFYCRELYSADKTQSIAKFPKYDQWREGFLAPTLATAYRFLRRKRYLLWNVSDIWLGDRFGPIEQDSLDILEKLGAEHVHTEKLGLANMPGSNRLSEDGTPTASNFVIVNGKPRKAEPIYVLWKP